MTTATLAIVAITLLFAIAITLRSAIASFQLCALCIGVSLTWISLLALLYLDYSVDPVLVAILIGASITGLLRLLEDKLPEAYNLFKLPTFLTLFLLAYFGLGGQGLYYGVIITSLLWAVSLVLFAKKESVQLKTFTQKIIQCCKNW